MLIIILILIFTIILMALDKSKMRIDLDYYKELLQLEKEYRMKSDQRNQEYIKWLEERYKSLLNECKSWLKL